MSPSGAPGPGGAPVAVLAGHGKTGKAVSAALGRRGVATRALGRGAWSDLPAALAGARAVYLIAPNLHPDEPGYVSAVLDAAARAGVGRVVYHSVAAPYAPDMPHHVGKARAEDLVRRRAERWTVLQPCAYVQNFVPALRADPPALRVPYDPDRVFGLVDLDDVAEAAAEVLVAPGHHGATYELAGPALVSVADVATAAEAVLGRPVPVSRVGPGEWVAAHGGALGARELAWLLAMFDYYDLHGLPAGPAPLATLLGRPATGLASTLARELTRQAAR